MNNLDSENTKNSITENYARSSENYSKKEKVFLTAIRKEIKSENIKTILLNIFVSIGFFSILTFNVFWLLQKLEIIKWSFLQKLDVISWFIFFIALIPGLILFFTLFIYSYIIRYRFKQERKFHFENYEDIDIHRVPHFIFDKYKRLSGFLILINWLAFASYIFGGIVLAILILLNGREFFSFWGLKITFGDQTHFPSYKWQIIWVSVYLGTIFLIHIAVVFYVLRNQGRLDAIFEVRNKINLENFYAYKRKVNIFCFCIFVLPIFLIILVFVILKKLKSGKK